jgi:hypothetical protein
MGYKCEDLTTKIKTTHFLKNKGRKRDIDNKKEQKRDGFSR